MPGATDADTIRILVATDNHVGFEEKDPIRKDDSWRTFDEIMQLAKKKDVDMVLLAGDLFHDNNPSRKSMFQVMRSLRKNCLGMRPCELEFLSDAADVFEGAAFPHVNYQDPDINVSIPVFSIHGNHDDPTGDGHYCPLDLLQMAGLVNYFGRVPEMDNIHVKPVLLQKGKTKLALYGLSNVRDERMHRTFRDNKVKWYRPNQQKTDFFSLLALHQNHHAHSATNHLPENMLPDFLDLVVWGHEHECLIDPSYNPETGFHVMQPGSSVATSLVPGEAVQKHVAVLSVTGKDFKVDKIPLRTVRPFVTRELVMSQDARFKGLAKKKDDRSNPEVTKRLIAIVNEMIQEAREDWLASRASEQGEDQDDEDEEEEDQMPLPLIRLRVEYSAPEGQEFKTENPQRFSQRFLGKVANVNDVVQFYKKKTATKRLKNGIVVPEEALEALAAGDAVQVETLVKEFFAAQSLRLLPQAAFSDAVTLYVNKEDKDRMETFVINALADQVQELLAMDGDGDAEAGDDLEARMAEIRKQAEEAFTAGKPAVKARRRMRPKPDGWDSDLNGPWVLQKDAFEEIAPGAPVKSAARGRPAKAKRAVREDHEDDFDDDMDINEQEEEAPPPKRKAPAKRATTRAAPAKKSAPAKKASPAKKAAPARGRKKAGPFLPDSDEEQEEEEEDVVMDDDNDDDEDDDFEIVDEPPRKPAPSRAAASRAAAPKRAPAKTKQSTLNFSQSLRPAAAAGGKSQQTALEISDDEIDDVDAFESIPASSARAGRRR